MLQVACKLEVWACYLGYHGFVPCDKGIEILIITISLCKIKNIYTRARASSGFLFKFIAFFGVFWRQLASIRHRLLSGVFDCHHWDR